MLSNLTDEERIAIFQKFTPASFSRLYRTCKWANRFIEENKRKIKIHIDKSLTFTSVSRFKPGSLREMIYDKLIKIQPRMGVSLDRIPFDLAGLESLLAEARFQCLVFNRIQLWPIPNYSPEDYSHILEMVATVAARNLGFWLHKSAILPQLPYNYEELHLNDIKTRQLDPIFDLAETHRHVWLTFARGFPPPADTVADVVARCCELIQKIIEGDFVNKRMYLDFRGETSRPAVLNRFLEEKGSETVVLAEGVQFHLIPLSLTSFIVVDWYKFKSVDTDSNYVFHFNVIESREMFNEHVNELYSKSGVRGIRLKRYNVLNLPVVQNICYRFFA